MRRAMAFLGVLTCLAAAAPPAASQIGITPGGTGTCPSTVTQIQTGVRSDNTAANASEQRVAIDETTALMGIALASRGAPEANFGALRDLHQAMSGSSSAISNSSLEKGTVFSALALGLHASGGALDALSCAADTTLSRQAARSYDRTVALGEDATLGAIALSSATGAPLRAADIATIRESRAALEAVRTDVNVGLEGALLVLTLGVGGQAGQLASLASSSP